MERDGHEEEEEEGVRFLKRDGGGCAGPHRCRRCDGDDSDVRRTKNMRREE